MLGAVFIGPPCTMHDRGRHCPICRDATLAYINTGLVRLEDVSICPLLGNFSDFSEDFYITNTMISNCLKSCVFIRCSLMITLLSWFKHE